MLSGFRFFVGAILATAMLGVSSLGLYTAVMLRHQAKAGPISSSRNLLFDDRGDWNQFHDPDGARRFEELARKPGASEPAGASVAPAALGFEIVTNATAARGPLSIERQSGEAPAAWAVTKDAAPAAATSEARAASPATAVIESEAPNPMLRGTPVWDEEPLLVADEPPLVMERTGSTQ
jgi:hypothetical protein